MLRQILLMKWQKEYVVLDLKKFAAHILRAVIIMFFSHFFFLRGKGAEEKSSWTSVLNSVRLAPI